MSRGPARTVLVVDDDHAIVEALSELLSWEGYTVRGAANGVEALQLLRQGRVDAVVLDLMMPRLGGLQTIEAMRQDPALAHIPVIVMSAAPLPARDSVPWVASLQKPFDLRALRAALTVALGGSRRTH